MSNEKRTQIEVEGMSCPSCVAHIKDALGEVDGVTGVEVRLRDGCVVIAHEDRANVDSLVKALRDAGYESSPKAA